MEPWVPTSRLDRVTEQRLDDSWVRQLWAEPASRVLVVDAAGDIAATPDKQALRFVAPSGEYEPDVAVLVGLVDGIAHFATVGDAAGPTATMRELIQTLPDTDTDVAASALAITNWHRVAPFCGVCGGATEVRQAGHVRYCPACDRERFPRTDPAVIVAVLDADDRLLLGHHVAWPEGRVSLLAGFVEAGESLEMTVRREIFEEAGVRLTAIRYVASQPWPFPRSLMLGFAATAATTDVAVDGTEIEHAAFYSRDEVRDLTTSGSMSLPSHASIASHLIEAWLDGTL